MANKTSKPRGGQAGRPQNRRSSPPAAKEGPTETQPGPKLKLPTDPARFLLKLLAVLGVIYAAALFSLRPASPGKEIRLDATTRYAVCGAPQPATPDQALVAYCSGADKRIAEATFLDQDAHLTGKLVNKADGGSPERFWTSYPKSDAATNDLLRNLNGSGAQVTVRSQTFKGLVRFVTQFLLPLLVLADLFALLFLLIQGGSGASEFLTFGRSKARRKTKAERGDITFGDVAAADEAVVELAEVRDYLANPSGFAKMGALPPKGVLLFGPPGCGKTLLARAVAGEVKASFFSMSGSEFVEALVGIGASRVRDLFAQARANTPAVIFIDELDAVGRQRGAGLGQGHDEREQTLNELLAQIDGFSPAQGIVVMGATNRPDILDAALLRAGRFDRHITIERPDVEGRLEILRLHGRGRPLTNPEDDLAAVAHDTPGFTGADLSNVLNEAALLAVRAHASSITKAHLDEAVERVMAGPRPRGRILSEDERRTIAYHEAGHAVVASALGKADGIRKLSIIARGRGIGHLATLDGDHTVVRREDMEAQIAVAMAGFAAEELVFGQPSSGSEADIERATTTARDMAGRYGMSPRLGPVRVLAQEKEVFLGRDYLSARDVSQPTLEHLDVEVRRILEDERNEAASILQSHRNVLDRVAAELLNQETLQGPSLAEVLRLPVQKAKAVAPRGRKASAAKRA